jgi:hypothetical protein
MSETIQRMQGETGNPITGILNNKDDSLSIPSPTPVTVTGRRIDTGEVVFADSPVTMTNYTTRAFSYEPESGATDWDTPCTVKLLFKIAYSNGAFTYVPDHTDYELRLQINPL